MFWSPASSFVESHVPYQDNARADLEQCYTRFRNALAAQLTQALLQKHQRCGFPPMSRATAGKACEWLEWPANVSAWRGLKRRRSDALRSSAIWAFLVCWHCRTSWNRNRPVCTGFPFTCWTLKVFFSFIYIYIFSKFLCLWLFWPHFSPNYLF